MSRNCLSGDQLHQQSYAVNSLEIIHRDYVVFAENEDFHGCVAAALLRCAWNLGQVHLTSQVAILFPTASHFT